MKKSRDRIRVCDVLQTKKEETLLDTEDFTDESVIPVEIDEAGLTTELPVNFNNVSAEAIEIPVINDEYGRISDVIEGLENATGMSVIPLEMGNIAPEVMTLARHNIFEFGKRRYAMSHKKRQNVLDSVEKRIMKALSAGVPFSEVLNTTITHNQIEYDTFSLSEDEWTYVMARFRNYKERLFVRDGKLTLEILAERAN